MYERMVGSVKRTLKEVLGNARLNFDEMHTVLVEIEGILNSRPLTYMYEDDCNVEILTPSHLIYGHRLSPIADNIDTSSIDSDDETLFSKRFVYLTKKLSHFWNRWWKEYLSNLRETHDSSGEEQEQMSEGDIVLIAEDNVKRN